MLKSDRLSIQPWQSYHTCRDHLEENTAALSSLAESRSASRCPITAKASDEDFGCSAVLCRAHCAPVELLNVFEALEVQAEDARQRADLHHLLGVLQAFALIAEEFVVRVQCLCCTAPPQTELRHLFATSCFR